MERGIIDKDSVEVRELVYMIFHGYGLLFAKASELVFGVGSFGVGDKPVFLREVRPILCS
jgi:hypothetical protein